MKKFCFLLMATVCFAYQAEAFVVKTIFFQPAGAPSISDRELTDLLEGIQRLYADSMAEQGFGRKTFRLEREGATPKIHRVRGRYSWAHYQRDTERKVHEELPDHLSYDITEPWKKRDDVYFIIVGGITLLNGVTPKNGWCLNPGGVLFAAGRNELLTVRHVAGMLRRCFGLYGEAEDVDPDALFLKHYEARWLDKHRHFNPRPTGRRNIKLPETIGTPTFRETPDMNGIAMTLDAISEVGLHQAIVVRGSDIRSNGWAYLDGQKRVTLNIAAAHAKWGERIFIMLMDTQGNYRQSEKFDVPLPESPIGLD